MYDEQHEYADAGNDIIHLYMQLLQVQLQKSDSDLYSKVTKDRPFGWAPIYQSMTTLSGMLVKGH